MNASSDFELEVFADGTITADENEFAHELGVACIEETYPPGDPISISLRPDKYGSYQLSAVGFTDSEMDPTFEAVVHQCEKGTIEIVGPLFSWMAVNPENRPYPDLVIECLIRTGEVPPTYDLDNWAADQNALGSGDESPDRTELDFFSEPVQACLEDPNRE